MPVEDLHIRQALESFMKNCYKHSLVLSELRKATERLLQECRDLTAVDTKENAQLHTLMERFEAACSHAKIQETVFTNLDQQLKLRLGNNKYSRIDIIGCARSVISYADYFAMLPALCVALASAFRDASTLTTWAYATVQQAYLKKVQSMISDGKADGKEDIWDLLDSYCTVMVYDIKRALVRILSHHDIRTPEHADIRLRCEDVLKGLPIDCEVERQVSSPPHRSHRLENSNLKQDEARSQRLSPAPAPATPGSKGVNVVQLEETLLRPIKSVTLDEIPTGYVFEDGIATAVQTLRTMDWKNVEQSKEEMQEILRMLNLAYDQERSTAEQAETLLKDMRNALDAANIEIISLRRNTEALQGNVQDMAVQIADKQQRIEDLQRASPPRTWVDMNRSIAEVDTKLDYLMNSMTNTRSNIPHRNEGDRDAKLGYFNAYLRKKELQEGSPRPKDPRMTWQMLAEKLERLLYLQMEANEELQARIAQCKTCSVLRLLLDQITQYHELYLSEDVQNHMLEWLDQQQLEHQRKQQ
eukprot:Clim_evm55s25 gene=Clim_evmTU55s25